MVVCICVLLLVCFFLFLLELFEWLRAYLLACLLSLVAVTHFKVGWFVYARLAVACFKFD
jgi:hypothetical protein